MAYDAKRAAIARRREKKLEQMQKQTSDPKKKAAEHAEELKLEKYLSGLRRR